MTSALRTAQAGDTADVARVWASAMRSEPMVRWPLADRDEAIAPMFMQLATDYVAEGVVWVDEQLRSAAAWLPPELSVDTTSFDERIRAAIASHTDDDGRHYFRFWEWVESHMPDEPVWFLDVLAVDPAAQGIGLGGDLLRHGIDLAARDNVAAMLETGNPENVPLYRHFGFEVWQQEAAPDGGPIIYFMLRPPR